MKVALTFRNFDLSGSLERETVILSRALVEAGVEVHCYTNPATRRADAPGVVFHDVRPAVVSSSRLGSAAELVSFALAATRALRRDRRLYDVVDVQGPSAWEHDVVWFHAVTSADQRRWPDLGGGRYRLPRLRASLSPLLRPQIAARRTIERLQLRRRPRVVVAVTEGVRDDLVRVHGVPPGLIEVIAPPIDYEAFASRRADDVRPELGLEEREPLLLFLGHDFERKGLEEAVRALVGLDPPAHLLVVGSGDRAPFAKLAADGGVGHRVHFVGDTNEPERFYRSADLLVMPSRHEPWGIPLVEAMAAGLPSVTTSVAGAARTVLDAGAGIVLDRPSPSDLRQAIDALLRSPKQRSDMAERGRAAAERFRLEHHVAAVLGVYERTARSSTSPARSS